MCVMGDVMVYCGLDDSGVWVDVVVGIVLVYCCLSILDLLLLGY